jgi:cytochrome c oxidase assembly protein Cox11
MTYQSKEAGIWQTTLILPFYDIPIKESRYLTMKIHCFSLWDEKINQSNEVLLPILNYYK